jgi:hypothetical protein
MRGLAMRVGIIGAILGGGYVFRDFITGAATDLQVGDCFDMPTIANETVDEVSHHPCTDSHTAEVYFVADHPGTTFPGEDGFETYVGDNCVPSFTAYTGLDYMTDTTYDFGWFEPTAEGWTGGDHEITCYIFRLDKSAMTQTVRVQ